MARIDYDEDSDLPDHDGSSQWQRRLVTWTLAAIGLGLGFLIPYTLYLNHEVGERFGGLDILVNNAGLATFHGIGEPGYEDTWTLALDVMLTAHMRFVRAALPMLKKSGEGRIVNVASTEGFGATPGNSPYVAAKHGVIGLTRALAVELGREGVTANCICPGPIRTGITEGIPDEHKEIFAKRRVPLRRYGLPEEVAHVTLSVVLPASSYLNGVAIPVDGGMLVKNA